MERIGHSTLDTHSPHPGRHCNDDRRMDRHRVAHRWYYAELLTLCLSPAAPVHRASVGYSAASLRGQMSAVGDFVHTVPEQRPLEAPARDLADCRQLQALQMMRRVHPLVKDANNRDAVVGDSEINHMPLDIAAAIARSNMITRRRGLRRFGPDLECRGQQVGVSLSLF